jgi:flagellar biosynthesis/type III secretory pathway protein FliH
LYPAVEIAGLFRSLDWLLALPEDYELQFREWKSSLFNQSSTPTMKLYTLESLARKEGHQEGRDEGIELGLKEGRQVGQIALLQRMLTQYFGVLPDWARDKLESANSQQLEAWADRIFTAKSLEDLLG